MKIDMVRTLAAAWLCAVLAIIALPVAAHAAESDSTRTSEPVRSRPTAMTPT